MKGELLSGQAVRELAVVTSLAVALNLIRYGEFRTVSAWSAQLNESVVQLGTGAVCGDPALVSKEWRRLVL